MKKIIYIAFMLFASLSVHAQVLGVKTNALYDATTTLSLGAEIGLSKKMTLDIMGAYNPWEFSDSKRMKLWLVQPELRYWLCKKFYGHFFGLHAHGGQYNISGINFSSKRKNNNYQGDYYGGGISYGYQWILNNRWNIEATAGVGYAHFKYDKYPCGKCGSVTKTDSKNYFGPTKVGVSLIYIIK